MLKQGRVCWTLIACALKVRVGNDTARSRVHVCYPDLAKELERVASGIVKSTR